jgi:ribosomal protein L16 Arg81 hydroxylase
MPLEDFNREVRERKLAHFTAAIEPALLKSVFSLPRLERLLNEDERLTSYIDIFDGTELRQIVGHQRATGQTNFDVVAEHLRRGATVRIRSADKFDPPLRELVENVERCLVGMCDGNVYLTPPAKPGFPPHFDITDVFVVQCIGKKHWRIYDDYTNKAELPLPNAGWEPERFKPTSPPRDFVLAAGDVLYLPRGVMHEAFCTDRESMHVTIGLASFTFADLLHKAVASAAASDIALRRRLPGFEADDAALEQLAQRAKDVLVRLATDSGSGAAAAARTHDGPAAPDTPTAAVAPTAAADERLAPY